MNKQEYIEPSCHVIQLDSMPIMAAVSGETEIIQKGDEEFDDYGILDGKKPSADGSGYIWGD